MERRRVSRNNPMQYPSPVIVPGFLLSVRPDGAFSRNNPMNEAKTTLARHFWGHIWGHKSRCAFNYLVLELVAADYSPPAETKEDNSYSYLPFLFTPHHTTLRKLTQDHTLHVLIVC